MKKIIETLIATLFAVALMATIAVLVIPDPVQGQGGTGPFGKRVTDLSNQVLVLPNMAPSPGTAGVPNNSITVSGGNLYVYQTASGLWYKATLASPTQTPTPTNTPTPTPTPTP